MTDRRRSDRALDLSFQLERAIRLLEVLPKDDDEKIEKIRSYVLRDARSAVRAWKGEEPCSFGQTAKVESDGRAWCNRHQSMCEWSAEKVFP